MKQERILVASSLLSILLLSLHLSDDVVRGMESGRLSNFIGVLILAVWLFGTLALAERRSGHVIVFVASLFASLIPAVHMRGQGLGGELAASSGAFFFIWTLIALGATALFSALVAARALWGSRRGRRAIIGAEPWRGTSGASSSTAGGRRPCNSGTSPPSSPSSPRSPLSPASPG